MHASRPAPTARRDRSGSGSRRGVPSVELRPSADSPRSGGLANPLRGRVRSRDRPFHHLRANAHGGRRPEGSASAGPRPARIHVAARSPGAGASEVGRALPRRLPGAALGGGYAVRVSDTFGVIHALVWRDLTARPDPVGPVITLAAGSVPCLIQVEMIRPGWGRYWDKSGPCPVGLEPSFTAAEVEARQRVLGSYSLEAIPPAGPRQVP